MSRTWFAGLAFSVIAGLAMPVAERPQTVARTELQSALQAAAQAPAGSAELQFDQGRQLFEVFQYDQAIAQFDRLIATLSADRTLKPELLAQTYELRARARFALGDTAGAEQDFSALLRGSPAYKLGPMSPRIVALFDNVKRATVGQLSASITPPGDVLIDGRPYTLSANAQVIELAAGDHEIAATRPGYQSVTQKFTIAAGDSATLAVTLERVSATLAVRTIPDGVEVIFDGAPKGATKKGDAGTTASAALVLPDLVPGVHRLELRRACYTTLNRPITIDKPADLLLEPLELARAIATAKIETTEPSAVVLVDGASRGAAPMVLSDVCEGPHTIEVRSPAGRFIDRREWRAGDTATLTPVLRKAFPLVSVGASGGRNPDALRADVERALAPAARVFVYAPAAADAQALQSTPAPPGWLVPDLAAPRLSRDAIRELARTVAAKVDAQGVAGIWVGADPSEIRISLLAVGSGEPDVLVVKVSDPESRARAVDALGRPLPPLVVPSMDASIIDVEGVQGAVVVRPGAAATQAGLAAGDTIVGASGTPVASVAALRAKIAAVRPPAMALSLDVKATGGAAKTVSVPVTMVPDAIRLNDPSVLSNLALLELQGAGAAGSAAERVAAQLNLAIVQMRLGNWADAQTALKQASVPEGPGVSAGTIAYLTGLCAEALGRTADARAAFASAAAATGARLWIDGPLVAPLAKQKLQAR